MLFPLSDQAIFIRVRNGFGHTCWGQFVPSEKEFQNLFHPWFDVYNKRSNLQSTFILASFTMVLFLWSKWWVQSFYLDALVCFTLFLWLSFILGSTIIWSSQSFKCYTNFPKLHNPIQYIVNWMVLKFFWNISIMLQKGLPLLLVVFLCVQFYAKMTLNIFF
jgi:hypothetical protein